MRILSLLPSATEMVCLLGLQDQLVGVSADSDWPPDVVKRLAVVNTVSIDPKQLSSREIDRAASEGHRGASLYHIDTELLQKLQPELILTQEVCEVCAVSRKDVDIATRALGYQPQVLSLSPATLDQVLADVELVGRTAGAVDLSRETVAALSARLECVRKRAIGLTRPRVFCMEWLDPPHTAGHWVPGMVELAGGSDELGTHGGPSRRVGWQEVLQYTPEIIVLIPCSLSLERVATEFRDLRSLPGWNSLPAVQSGLVFAGHTHLFSRSGPRLIEGVETLARILHPETFNTPIPAGRALKMAQNGDRLEPYQ